MARKRCVRLLLQGERLRLLLLLLPLQVAYELACGSPRQESCLWHALCRRWHCSRSGCWDASLPLVEEKLPRNAAMSPGAGGVETRRDCTLPGADAGTEVPVKHPSFGSWGLPLRPMQLLYDFLACQQTQSKSQPTLCHCEPIMTKPSVGKYVRKTHRMFASKGVQIEMPVYTRHRL